MTLSQQKPSECSTMAHYGLSGAQDTPHHIPNQALHEHLCHADLLHTTAAQILLCKVTQEEV